MMLKKNSCYIVIVNMSSCYLYLTFTENLKLFDFFRLHLIPTLSP